MQSRGEGSTQREQVCRSPCLDGNEHSMWEDGEEGKNGGRIESQGLRCNWRCELGPDLVLFIG